MVDTTLKHLIIAAGFVGLGMAQALKANREVMKNGIRHFCLKIPRLRAHFPEN